MYKTEEQRKKENELVMARRKKAFECEQRSVKINQLKIQAQWKTILKKVKSEALSQELEILKQVHERHVDRKNHAVQEAAITLTEADNQYDMAYQAQIQNVDNLLDLQYARLYALERDFEMTLKELESEFNNERVRLHTQHMKEKNDILGVMYRMDHDFTETEADARHEYQSGRDDVKNRNLEEKHALRIQLESTIEDLWRQFQLALTNYTTATDERKRQFEDLKAKDEQSALVIETQLRKLGKLAESVSQLKSKLTTNARDAEQRLTELKLAKERVVVDFQALKRKMNGYRDAEKRKRIDLTRVANLSTQKLEKQVKLAEKIIKLTEMNSKLETSDEKLVWAMHCDTTILNSPTDTTSTLTHPVQVSLENNGLLTIPDVNKEEENNNPVQSSHQLNSDPHPTNPLKTAVSDSEIVSIFHKRYNKVLLDKLTLEAKREKLQEENESLRAVLKEYLNGISVNENIMDSVNPLVMVNGRTNIILPKRTPKVITVVEGGTAVRNAAIASSRNLGR